MLAQVLDEAGILELCTLHPLPPNIKDELMNLGALAVALETSTNTVKAWHRAGMPARIRGRNGRAYAFQLSHCYAWVAEHDQMLGDRLSANSPELVGPVREHVAGTVTGELAAIRSSIDLLSDRLGRIEAMLSQAS
ncbi:MAG: hypothetical protein ABIQ30_00200 [Devosia sp.]